MVSFAPKAPPPLSPPAASTRSLASPAFTVGDYVRDSISGIKGRIVAVTEWLHRSPEVAVARLGRDVEGKPWDLIWMDEARVSICAKDE